MKKLLLTLTLACFSMFGFAQASVDINKIIDGVKFIKVQTGWKESQKTPGLMYPEVRLLVRNSSGAAIKDPSIIYSKDEGEYVYIKQLTYTFYEEDIALDESFSNIHSRSSSAWKPNISKYVELDNNLSFKNLGEGYKNKKIFVEIYYHEKYVCKVNIAPVLADW